MATATKAPVIGYRLTLELSQKEAEVLVMVLNRVGGAPSGSRGKAEGILLALKKAGVQYSETGKGDPIGETDRAIYFTD